MKAVIQPLAWGFALASILAVATGFALAVTAGTIQATEHAHQSHQRGAEAALLAPDGQKWANDPSLREGMTRIQNAVQRALPNGHSASIDAAAAARLRDATSDAIAYMVDHCELPADADAALHLLLAEMLKGTDALEHAELHEAGLEYIASALQRYAIAFDEPLWR